MEIKAYDSGLLASNMYIISENGHAVVIDPSRDTSPAKGLTVDLLIVTHEHYDHISGVNDWKREYGAPLLCSEKCAGNLGSTLMNQARHFDVFCELQTWIELDEIPQTDHAYTCSADMSFTDSMSLEWQGHELRLIEIPGHSQGSIGIFLDDDGFFSGDSLMEDSGIALRLPGGRDKPDRNTDGKADSDGGGGKEARS